MVIVCSKAGQQEAVDRLRKAGRTVYKIESTDKGNVLIRARSPRKV